MVVDKDQEWDWVTSQTVTTCNIEPGYFNDWVSGHLNYQIEHQWVSILGVEVLHQIFDSWFQCAMQNWTQWDLRFCKNEGSRRSKINEKSGQLSWKSTRKLIQKFKKTIK